jgi:hypothetical protein
VTLSEYLDRMVITNRSPDGRITARVVRGSQVEVEFANGAYTRYDETSLGHQLARLGVTTWVGYVRGRDEAVRRSLGLSEAEFAALPKPDSDPRIGRYDDALNTMAAEGRSVRGAVTIRTVGMLRWDVHVRPGAIRQFDEPRFVTEIHSAYSALMNDRQLSATLLRADHFDMGFPKRWLEIGQRVREARRRADSDRRAERGQGG